MTIQAAVTPATLSSTVFKAFGVQEDKGLRIVDLPSRRYDSIDSLEISDRSVSHSELSKAFGHASAEAREGAAAEIDSLVERRESAQKWRKIFNWGGGASIAGFIGAAALGVNPWLAANGLLWGLFAFLGGANKRQEAERLTGQIGDVVDEALVNMPRPTSKA